MVQHSGADDQIELVAQLSTASTESWWVSRLVVFLSEPASVFQAGRADVDAHDASPAGRAHFAACHVPQPAMRMSRSARNGFEARRRGYSARFGHATRLGRDRGSRPAGDTDAGCRTRTPDPLGSGVRVSAFTADVPNYFTPAPPLVAIADCCCCAFSSA